MKQVYQKFVQLIVATEQVQSIYDYINCTIKAPLDCSDLLRWQWVQFVSAFDKLIHDLVRIGMVEIYLGKRKPTPRFKSFSIDMETQLDLLKNCGSQIDQVKILNDRIFMVHQYLSFQQPKKVVEALSYICEGKNKWGDISKKLNMDKDDCVKFLNNIIIRRNQIAHEGDFIGDSNDRQNILREDVVEIKEFILKLGEVIYEYVNDARFKV